MSTVAEYQGRTVDVLAYTNQELGRETVLVPVLAYEGTGGEVCTGIQKLGQRFLLELLTARGTMRYLPERGTDFMGALVRGELRTTFDVTQAFNIAVQQAQYNLQLEEAPTDPDDERFARADLEGVAIVGDSLAMRISVRSRAGTSRQVIMPISTRIN